MSKKVSQNVWRELNWMDRSTLEYILEDVGIATYDDESNDDLRHAIVDNIIDGTICEDVIIGGYYD